MPRVRVYLACSLDGYIAGPDDDLSWLEPPEGASAPGSTGEGLDFETFMGQVGAMLMGRRTFDVVEGMGAWPYGDTPVLVATRRSLEPSVGTVRAVAGSIEDIVAAAKAEAGGGDVYLDGGGLVRQALDAGLVDELTLTLVPVLLGGGVRLFEGAMERRRLEFVQHHDFGGGMVQITLRPEEPQ